MALPRAWDNSVEFEIWLTMLIIHAGLLTDYLQGENFLIDLLYKKLKPLLTRN